jgi:pimeloyl-ACP methyl ester carboxylesterase
MKRSAVLFLFCAFVVLSLEAQTTAPLLTPESKLPARHSVAVFGQKIVYYDIGAGPAIVLVHGFGSEARFDWGNVLMPLSQRHQIQRAPCCLLRLPPWRTGYRDFLGEFLRTLNVHEFTLVGESLGGWISALYTIESLAPANTGANALPAPRRLVVEDAAGMSAAHMTGQSMPIPIAGTLADAHGVAIVFYDKSRVTDEFVREAWAMKMKANDGFTERSIWSSPKIAAEVVKDRLGTISVPALVVWGGNDELVALEQGRAYAAGIPGAKFVVVPDCGHAPSIEKPKEFLDAVIPFIDAH